MRNIYKTFFSILVCLIANATLAQTTIPVTGGTATGTGGTISYSIGQVAVKPIQSAEGTLNQGVQLPYEIYIVTSVEDLMDNLLFSVVYPNPTTELLTLKVEDHNFNDLTYWLYGSDGTVIVTGRVFSEETIIPVGNLSSGTYILKLTSGNKGLATLKVIKTNNK